MNAQVIDGAPMARLLLANTLTAVRVQQGIGD